MVNLLFWTRRPFSWGLELHLQSYCSQAVSRRCLHGSASYSFGNCSSHHGFLSSFLKKNKLQVHMLRKLPFKIVVKLFALWLGRYYVCCFSQWEVKFKEFMCKNCSKSNWSQYGLTLRERAPSVTLSLLQLFLFYWLILIRYAEVSLILKILPPTLYFMFLFDCSLLSSSLWTSTLKVWCTFLSPTSISTFLTSLHYVTFLKPILS